MAVPLSEKLKIGLKLLIKPKVLNALISLKHSGYLVDIGWFNAFVSQSSVGKANRPLPWVTYPFIDFIEERLTKEMTVFEFGSGNSTLFYASKVKAVTTVEHNKKWHDKISKSMPGNVEMIYREEDEDGKYCRAAKNTGKKYDIVIVDAIDRNNCVKQSVEVLNPNGVLILDDSDREEYKEGIDYLIENGFKKIEFWGISPGYLNRKSTTVFYKSDNCLKI